MRVFILFSLLVLSCFVFGCQQEQNNTTIDSSNKDSSSTVVSEEKNEEAKTSSMPYYITTTDNLRLRAEPNTNSDIVATLSEGQLLRDLEERGGNDFVTTINGREVKDNWRKVIITTLTEETGEMGWVFGGGVRPTIITSTTLDEGKVKRAFKDVSGAQIAKITNLEVPDYKTEFKGYLTFIPVAKGRYLLDGPFEIRGDAVKMPVEFTGVELFDIYSGAYKNGSLDGRLNFSSKGYEVYTEGYITFKDGKCVEGKLTEEGEGMTFKADEKNMPECTFRYLGSKMVDVTAY